MVGFVKYMSTTVKFDQLCQYICMSSENNILNITATLKIKLSSSYVNYKSLYFDRFG